mmetsp:Transcript_155263/g.476938  ORF Transcript_155263/g.476938 Transcript_155263/m.476938 type:complete len:274 (+) Transcript_155263:101-922(+)
MDAVNAERSKLVQRQKQQKQELEKKVKKLKGAMKEAAAKELEELETKHEAELAEFEKEKGGGGGAAAKPAAAAAAAPAAEAEPAKDAKQFRERHWSGLSKKELEEECVARGIGKKGSKEDLIQKLIIFHQDLALKAAEAGPAASEADGRKEEKPDPTKEEADESEDEDEESEDESEDGEALEVDSEEMERQHKREKLVQKAIVFLFQEKQKDSFHLDELTEKLKLVKVSNFSPEKLGYKSLEKFVKGQKPAVLRYDRKTQMISPPRPAASSSS